MSNEFDVIVIGAGPGGYISAIRAAQLGKTVACIDEWQDDTGGAAPGGTCTNVGCIPSKALLESSALYEQAQLNFKEHGISLKELKIDPIGMLKRKDDVVKQNNQGVLYLFKKNKVSFFHGKGVLSQATNAGYEVKVVGKDAATLQGKDIIIATGSVPRALPNAPFDEKRILSNTGALNLKTVPKKLVLVGSGVIGLEMGSVWRRLGAEVTVLEALPDFLPMADADVVKEALKAFTKQGLNIEFGVKVESVKTTSKEVGIAYTNAKGELKKLKADHLVVSIGRVPNTQGLSPEAIGLELDERGGIKVNEHCQTNLPHVWAVGDVVRGPMLAHKAEDEGVAVAERIVGQKPHVNFNTIPSVIYTHPEVAWVGQSEQQLKAAGIEYKKGSFPFMANGRARAIGDTTGFVKILADAKSDEVLGVHMVGPYVSELIAEAVMAMEFKASAEDIARICHAHPTLSEAVKEAALAVAGRTLNF